MASVRRRVLARMLAHEWRTLVLLALALGVVIAVVTILNGVQASTGYAERQTAYGANAGYGFSITAPPRTREYRTLQAAQLPRLSSSTTRFRTSTTLVDATAITASSQRLADRYGTSVNGRAGGQLALSRALAASLQVAVGDPVRVVAYRGDRTLRVGRIFVLPAIPSLTAGIWKGPAPPGASNRWLLNDAGHPQGLLYRLLESDRSTVILRGSENTARDQTTLLNASRFVALRYVPLAGMVLALATWLGLAAVVQPTWRRHEDALRAAGFTGAEARGLVRRCFDTTLVIGLLLGLLAGSLVVFAGYRLLGLVVGHYWTTGVQSAGLQAPFLITVLPACWLLTRLVTAERMPRGVGDPAPLAVVRRVLLAGGAVGLVGLAATPFFVDSPQVLLLAFLSAMMVVVALPEVAYLAVARRLRRRPAVGAAVDHFAAATLLSGLGAVLVLQSAGFMAAFTHAQFVDLLKANRPNQPVGSVAFEAVDSATAKQLVSAWRSNRSGAMAAQYALPVERESTVRVARPACVSSYVHRVGGSSQFWSCVDRTEAPVSYVAIGARGDTEKPAGGPCSRRRA